MKRILPCIALTIAIMPLATPAALPIEDSSGFQDLDFGLDHLRREAAAYPATPGLSLHRDATLPPQGFRLETCPPLALHAADAAGLQYGLLELAEQLRLYGPDGIQATEQAPAILTRGIKFNLPLDVRTPTYTESGDAAQIALEEVWNFAFWTELIDRLAAQRYNLVSLWNLHPFPSLVKVPEFPDIALDDVRRSTTKWDEFYPLSATGYDTPEITRNYETLHHMTIEQKIDFWQRVMAYGKSRHVDFYLITWNIFVNGTDGKYGIDDDIRNPITRSYFRASIKAVLEAYPDLAGIGLTTGENMPAATLEEKEDWAFETYGLGALDVARAQPGRNIAFIHRQHQTGAQDIADRFAALIDQPNIDFVFSFKYAEAHVMSAVRQPFADQFLQDIPPQKTLWTLRNDDNYHFRWGGADFVRAFIQAIPAAPTAGVYYGSDQWVWAREFLALDPAQPRELELSKHWYHWLLWGRLSYDPQLPERRLVDVLAQRFPGIDAPLLFRAWQDASATYPIVTGFHWGALDFQWYIEASQSLPGFARTPNGFHDINRFISLPPHPGSDYASIPEYIESEQSGQKLCKLAPPEVTEALRQRANAALAAVRQISSSGRRELHLTLDDIEAMAHLGLHYANKIDAATYLAAQRSRLTAGTGHPRQLAELQRLLAHHLNQAAFHWRVYSALAASRYRSPVWTNRVGHVDLRKTYQSVLYDLTICGVEADLPSMPPTPGGQILEAETARTQSPILSEVPGYTGSGYVDLQHAEGVHSVEWTHHARRAGTHVLEFRHTQRWGGASMPARLEVNGRPIESFAFGHSGTNRNWVWDRASVPLQAGPNRISITPGGAPLIDHLNVIDTGY